MPVCNVCQHGSEATMYIAKFNLWVHPECVLHRLIIDTQDTKIYEMANILTSRLKLNVSMQEIADGLKTANVVVIVHDKYIATYTQNGVLWGVDGIVMSLMHLIQIILTNLSEPGCTIKFLS